MTPPTPDMPAQGCPRREVSDPKLPCGVINQYITEHPAFNNGYALALLTMMGEHILMQSGEGCFYSGYTPEAAVSLAGDQIMEAFKEFSKVIPPAPKPDDIVQVDETTAMGIINAAIRRLKSQKALADKAGLTPQEVSNMLNQREGRRMKPALFRAAGVLTGNVFFTARSNVPRSGKIIG